MLNLQASLGRLFTVIRRSQIILKFSVIFANWNIFPKHFAIDRENSS